MLSIPGPGGEGQKIQGSNSSTSIKSPTQRRKFNEIGETREHHLPARTPGLPSSKEEELQNREPQMEISNPDNSMQSVSQSDQEFDVSSELYSLQSDLESDAAQQKADLDRCWAIIAELNE